VLDTLVCAEGRAIEPLDTLCPFLGVECVSGGDAIGLISLKRDEGHEVAGQKHDTTNDLESLHELELRHVRLGFDEGAGKVRAVVWLEGNMEKPDPGEKSVGLRVAGRARLDLSQGRVRWIHVCGDELILDDLKDLHGNEVEDTLDDARITVRFHYPKGKSKACKE